MDVNGTIDTACRFWGTVAADLAQAWREAGVAAGNDGDLSRAACYRRIADGHSGTTGETANELAGVDPAVVDAVIERAVELGDARRRAEQSVLGPIGRLRVGPWWRPRTLDDVSEAAIPRRSVTALARYLGVERKRHDVVAVAFEAFEQHHELGARQRRYRHRHQTGRRH